MRLRVAGPDDAAAVRALSGDAPAREVHAVLAEDRDGAIGTMALSPEGRITGIGTREGAPEGMVLTALYDAIEAEAVRRHLMLLRIARPGTGLADFLRRRGWEPDGDGGMVRDRVGRA